MRADWHNGILMFFIVIVAETIKDIKVKVVVWFLFAHQVQSKNESMNFMQLRKKTCMLDIFLWAVI